MLIELVQTQTAKPTEPQEDYDEELHDVNAIIMDLCIALGETHAFEFRVSGFGDERWPLDIATDLATVLGQLPGALSACAAGAPFELNLFEQGVERRLEFEPKDTCYEVRCLSLTDWQPKPQIEQIDTALVRSMLQRLKDTFCEICENLLPATSAHPWFKSYVQGPVR
jgi:hypothetical protein